MESSLPSANFQFGLLHFLHLLSMVDGVIDEREKNAVQGVIEEEQIPEAFVQEFQKKVNLKTEKEIYRDGLEFLNRCNEAEKKRAFVHLYHLSEADDKIHVREVRLLLYSLKATRIEFEDVELLARLPKIKKELVDPPKKDEAA